jgi:hypothetical protein
MGKIKIHPEAPVKLYSMYLFKNNTLIDDLNGNVYKEVYTKLVPCLNQPINWKNIELIPHCEYGKYLIPVWKISLFEQQMILSKFLDKKIEILKFKTTETKFEFLLEECF